MYSFNFDYDEGILIESENAFWESKDNIELKNLVLTNKNIYCVYEKSNGLFKKATEEVNILSVSDIKVINGQALVQQIKHDGSWCLQIQFRQGTEYFSFYESPKKVIPQWVAAINNALGISVTNVSAANAQKTAKRSNIFGGAFAGAFSEVADNFRNVVDNVSETFGVQTRQGESSFTPANNPNYAQSRYTQQSSQPIQTEEHQHRFCVNCGAKLDLGTRFCPACGCKVENSNPTQATEQYVSETKTESLKPSPVESRPTYQKTVVENTTQANTQRQQEYVGKIYKCPNCGNIINQSDTICNACGYHLSGKQAISSAMDFQHKMMEIEMTRKKTGFFDTENETDKKILALVKSYPIPNSIEDIVEFMHIAIGNIDVGRSKKSFVNWLDSSVSENQLSNAWVAKMQQIYKKAELYFPNEPEFVHIKEIYDSTMKELKMK